MPVIRPAIAVFPGGAAEFGHRNHHHILEAVAQVLRKRCKRRAKLLQTVRKLSDRGLWARFVYVVIPSADIGESNFHSYIGFDQLSNLAHALAKAAPGVICASRRLVGTLLHRLEQRYSLKCLPAGATDNPILGARVHRFEHLCSGGIAYREVCSGYPPRQRCSRRATRVEGSAQDLLPEPVRLCPASAAKRD